MNLEAFQHQTVLAEGTAIHVVEAGSPLNPAILFLHGYPENWLAFEEMMNLLKGKYRVLGLGKVTLVGHDVGGMITYAMIRHFAERLTSAVILGTAIPGVEPWEEVKRNPYIWHFAFYSVPRLPEILAAGRLRPLFDYFYDTLSHRKGAIGNEKRDPYVRGYEDPASLSTGFDWYRAFPLDEKDNSVGSPVNVPLLYIRGDKDYGRMEDYSKGLKKNGIKNLTTLVVRDSGHFVPEEQPEAVARGIEDFVNSI